jgi:hypothetical protein
VQLLRERGLALGSAHPGVMHQVMGLLPVAHPAGDKSHQGAVVVEGTVQQGEEDMGGSGGGQEFSILENSSYSYLGVCIQATDPWGSENRSCGCAVSKAFWLFSVVSDGPASLGCFDLG